jgi:hypothetical protein
MSRLGGVAMPNDKQGSGPKIVRRASKQRQQLDKSKAKKQSK